MSSKSQISSSLENASGGPRALCAACLLALAACSTGGVNTQTTPVQNESHTVAEVFAARSPFAVSEIVAVHPFTLREAYQYDWSADRRIVQSGLIIVLKADSQFLMPRDGLEPVLYAGDRTVQRLNHGAGSGHLIAIIPGEIDLADAPIWFGRPELPERVSKEMVRSERSLADKAGIKPFTAQKVRSVTRPRIEAADLAALLRDRVADLVIQYAPDERRLAETWRLPVAKPL